MSSKKDMRRPDLVVPYLEPAPTKSDGDISGALTSTLPMAAIFTRNKLIGWTALTVSIQSWLAENEDSKKNAATPAIMSVGMAVLSLGVAYMQYFLPPVQQPGSATASAPLST